MIYQDFPYHPADLSAFGVTYGIFVISLKDGNIVHYTPGDEEEFYRWLQEQDVREVQAAC